MGEAPLRFLYDTAIFVYALGRDHPYKDPCRSIVRRATDGELLGEACTELVQEFLHVQLRGRRDRKDAVAQARNVAELCRLHPFEPRDIPMVLTLVERHAQLQPRDAVFAATALNREIPVILSTDRGFDVVSGLRRVDPSDQDAVAELTR